MKYLDPDGNGRITCYKVRVELGGGRFADFTGSKVVSSELQRQRAVDANGNVS